MNIYNFICEEEISLIPPKRYKFCENHNYYHDSSSCISCSIEESHKKYNEENSYCWIECKICGYRAKDLSSHLRHFHNIHPKDYKRITKTNTIKSQFLCDKVKGENNPGYQHDGKFSPFSKKFVKADSIDIEELYERVAKSRKENCNETTTIEHWLKQTNGDVEQAKLLLRDRQSTFTLEKCISKYGKEEGFNRWNQRQLDWQTTLNSKTEEEIQNINKKKSTKINFKSLWNQELDSEGKFYVIKLDDETNKIGITSKEIYERYDVSIFDREYYVFESTINHAFQIEQITKNKLFKYIINKEEQIGDFGWTETFRGISYEDILNIIEPLKNQKNSNRLFNQLRKKHKEKRLYG
jgi:hypothetical protein